MGFMDKLKNAAQTALEQVDKAIEQQKAKEDQKASADLKGISDDGMVKGGSAAIVMEEKANLHFSIDEENRRLIVYNILYGILGTNNKLVAEYSLDDIVAFQHNKQDSREGAGETRTMFYNTLVLTSGETLEIYNSVGVREDRTRLGIQQESKDWMGISKVIVCFIEKISDDKTKQWVNQFYLDYGEDAPFDENGVVEFSSFFNMSRKLLNKKSDLWLKELKTLQ